MADAKNALFWAIDRKMFPFHGIPRGIPLAAFFSGHEKPVTGLHKNRRCTIAPSHVHSQPDQHHHKQEAPSRSAGRLRSTFSAFFESK